MRALVTAGATIEQIDPIRYISNFSSGKQGYAIANALKNRGFDVTLITGNCNLPPIDGINIIKISSALEMLDLVLTNLPVDIAIFAAAVGDWRVKKISKSKLKKTDNEEYLELRLIKNPDILKIVSNHETLRPKLVIGFAAETDNLIQNAKIKLENKKCDFIIANLVTNQNNVFGNENNEAYLIGKNLEKHFSKRSKTEIANRLVEFIETICY